MVLRRIAFLVAASLALPSLPRIASAEPSMADKSESHALFERAMVQYKKSAYADALKLFLGSQDLDPGVGTLLYIGECYKQLGKPASAWGAFKEAMSLAQKLGDKRGDVAKEKAAEVEGQMSYLRIDVPDSAKVPGLEVKRDGKVVSSSLFGTSVPVDPGTYTIEASAPGYASDKGTVQVGEKGAKATHMVKPLKANAAPPATGSAAATAPTATAPSMGESKGTEVTHGPWRTVGFVGIGVGLAVGVVGGLGMLQGSSDADKARTNKDTPAYNDAKSVYNRGLLLTLVGVAVVGTGTALVIVDPGKKETTAWRAVPVVGPGQAGLSLGRRFLLFGRAVRARNERATKPIDCPNSHSPRHHDPDPSALCILPSASRAPASAADPSGAVPCRSRRLRLCG